jgi:hypothetical protein
MRHKNALNRGGITDSIIHLPAADKRQVQSSTKPLSCCFRLPLAAISSSLAELLTVGKPLEARLVKHSGEREKERDQSSLNIIEEMNMTHGDMQA